MKISTRYMSQEEKLLLRNKLYEEQEGNCIWCQQPMQNLDYGKLSSEYESKKKRLKLLSMIPNHATFEHLYDRFSFPNGRDHLVINMKLSCAKCNHARNCIRTKVFWEFVCGDLGVTSKDLHAHIRGKKPVQIFNEMITRKDDLINLLDNVYFAPPAC